MTDQQRKNLITILDVILIIMFAYAILKFI
jgi:hypothetical protein